MRRWRVPTRGGKLLVFHGTADPIFSALESIDYYERLTRNSGGGQATSTWARLFLVPGMNHCAGGPATDSFDGLAAITDWVEKGVAPARIEASALPGSAVTSRGGRGRCARTRRPHATAAAAASKTERTSPVWRSEPRIVFQHRSVAHVTIRDFADPGVGRLERARRPPGARKRGRPPRTRAGARGTGECAAGTRAGRTRATRVDPRVQVRMHHFAETSEDIPYALFVSSKVDPRKKAPMIVSLHGLGGTHRR